MSRDPRAIGGAHLVAQTIRTGGSTGEIITAVREFLEVFPPKEVCLLCTYHAANDLSLPPRAHHCVEKDV